MIMEKRMQLITGILTCVLAIFVVHVQAQSPKAKNGTFALTNATIETVTKGTINNGTIVMANGKIQALGTNVLVPANAEVIDCKGLRIYPGMIDAGGKIGLLEIGQIPQGSDEAEKGDVLPQIKALTAINPNATAIPVTRVSGITTA